MVRTPANPLIPQAILKRNHGLSHERHFFNEVVPLLATAAVAPVRAVQSIQCR